MNRPAGGWMKIGQTTMWKTRHPQLSIDFRKRYGWTIVRHWQSNPVSAIRQQGAPRSVLGGLEIHLRRHAGQPDEVTVLSDPLPHRGRGICGADESETFRGQSFGDLVAYADVLTRCSASEA
ncbi:MAG: hypothetical protein WAW17_16995 [Rhodococcus sp. (in: high G+C Gram-positive bacteria)]|uniref:hypothetical protein n=1 Tax=Rhodococcus sp. TaxID=1831 RepID=UPI003BAFE944